MRRPLMRVALAIVALIATAGAATAQKAAAPQGRCRFIIDPYPDTRVDARKLASGQYNSFVGGGLVARCPAQGIVLRADSLEAYGDEGRLYFVGHVNYKEPRLQLQSEFLTYFQTDERLLAVNNVDARLPSGSTIKGPQLEFLRAVPRLRPRQQATAIGRPTISLVEKDAQGRAQPPVTVTGNTVWLMGDSIVSAQGTVVVVRPQLTATGDSIYADGGSGLLRIMRQPRIVGTKGRPFTLVGETIDLITRRRKLDQVLAKAKAEAQSEDLNLKSDTIDMRVTNDLLQRAIVWGKGRAHATSPTQSVVADSIDVLLPGQRVRELHAVRAASAEGLPDTTRFVLGDRDRLTGDTIIALFDSIPARDTVTRPRIRELHAMGHATSLRSVPPSDTTLCRPMVVYARGRVIDVRFRDGKVQNVGVVDRDSLSAGLQLEPRPDSANLCRVLRPGRAAAAAPASVGPGTRPAARQPAPGRPASSPVALPPAALPGTRRP